MIDPSTGLHWRSKNRLSGYDYSQEGWYFVTICTKDRIDWFGEVVEGKMVLNTLGQKTCEFWKEIPKHFPDVCLDEFIVMPDHVHGIIFIKKPDTNVGNKNFCSLRMESSIVSWQT
ncbi:MAG: hypothetical protein UX09_C0031G0013 [Candidatus Uhrbacteria bacterium GW2011_GWE2_45_35]|uniref:Transposase IS200-like domain-containing protein n=1 Tax=Candidatus Uhrbacteria bacterium GW2011_GWE2_45_35 TaxID=1618993 RepID=A0A0G1MGW8_9BACT|nr:MAG: hypothetical protein UX09_C0031G0013 [Candidatus Uhrbacteria bacterium GW2011_GWE2_45_35]HBR80819.1 hypothetical protein [Candidatus Uhrbacteria bacterium]HCU32150.1 hypothetical protein [Candidatus Uhrbacteria bacterium]